MAILITGTLVFVLPGGWALRRARNELQEIGRIAPLTFLAAFIAYTGHATATLLAAWASAWPLPIPPRLAVSLGAVAAIIGIVLYLSARLRFRSFRLTWGLETSRLVTSGVYRFSRNPQTLGALLVLTGAAIAGNSGVALLLAALGWVGASIWVPTEEGILEKLFGEEYRQYRQRVPRYLGRRR
ncbi:MAG: isoprenylcysteine carboxylmethyltransferase family protein [Thermoanaerobaculia bacterium]